MPQEATMSEHAGTPNIGMTAEPTSIRDNVREITGYWWVGLVAGIAWLVISLVILQFDSASVATVGILVGFMFLLAGAQNLAVTTLPVEHRWVPALFSVLFLISAVVCFIDPVDTFAGLADMLGFLFLLVGVWWMIQSFLERPVNPMWWLNLISGIVMTGIAFWTAGQLFATKAYTLLVFAGISALMQGTNDIVRALEVRRVHKDV
jgi:uncharacterized membrane protein HdeD (DUF308 family)